MPVDVIITGMVEINLFNHAQDTRILESGAVLFSKGDPGDVMYAVIEGQIALSIDGAHLDTIGQGGIIGELALIDAAPRSATATATESTRVAAVDHEYFTFLVQEHPTFALQVMGVMAERLRKANEHA
jgi:CRP/FNR family cyclic AMP-dependent transcriptional regulator